MSFMSKLLPFMGKTSALIDPDRIDELERKLRSLELSVAEQSDQILRVVRRQAGGAFKPDPPPTHPPAETYDPKLNLRLRAKQRGLIA